MKTDSGSFTHNAKTPGQARHYRALATGVCSDAATIARTGAMRSQRVADHMPAEQRRALVPNSGYPEPLVFEVMSKGY